MKTIFLSVLATLTTVSAFANHELDIVRYPVIASYVSTSKLDPALENRYLADEGMISINEESNEVTLTLFSRIGRCPVGAKCIWSGAAPTKITLPIVSHKSSRFNGEHTYVAAKDQRPVDGHLKVIRIVSNEKGTFTTYKTQGYHRMQGVEVKTESTFEGTAFKRVRPLRALSN